MAVFKCKICGGELKVQDGLSTVKCEYCGTMQDLSKMVDEPFFEGKSKIYFLYQKNICKDKKHDNNVLHFKTCEHCHTNLAGLWEYPENLIECYGTFYDERRGGFKYGYNVFVYANFSYVAKNMFHVDLNTFVLHGKITDRDLSNTDITDEQAIKKLVSFGLVSELSLDEVREQDAEFYDILGTKYFVQKYKKCTTLDELSEGEEIPRGHYYVDDGALGEYLDYLKSEDYLKILELKKEIVELKEIDKCPICGGTLSKHRSVDVYIPSNCTQSEALKICSQKILKLTESVSIEACKVATENYISNIFNANRVVTNIKTTEICNTNDIKNYVKNVLAVEKLVLEITERLKKIYPEYYIAEKGVFVAEKICALENARKRDAFQKEYENALNSEFVPTVTLEKVQIKLPDHPIEPTAPVKPIIKEAGLFNKKKVAAENEIINNEYFKMLEDYNRARAKYLSDMEIYTRTVDELMQERKRKYEELLHKEKEQHQQKIDALKAQLDKEQVNVDSCGELQATPERAKYNLLKLEKEEAEELLIKAVKLREELYSYDVIFEKYRDIVSIATFYEYLSSGRCQELGGPDGAYNLYENEIRMNMIISQMDRVIESLEQIKQNQFVIYSTLQSMNSKLSQLNESMNKAVKSIVNIEASVDSIDNTAEVIAYNTERTAYYAQKNAELTNALGYLVALS